MDGAADPNSFTTLADDAEDTIRWSPDGKAIYFISYADGPACLWAARLDLPGDRRPVAHFHEPRRALLGSFDVSSDSLYLGIHETSGNLWVGKVGR